MDIDKQLIQLVEDDINAYKSPIDITEGLQFSQKDTDRRIVFYSFNKYLSGNKDKYGRRKPYKQIINQAVELEASRTDIEITNIDLISLSNDYIKTLVLEEELIKYAEDTRLNKTLQELNETYIRYGGVLPKKIETRDSLIIEPINWLNATTNQTDVFGGFITDEQEMSLIELESKSDVYENVDEILDNAKKKKEKSVTIIDAEGEVSKSFITEKESDEDDTVIGHIIYAKVNSKKFILFKEILKESSFKYAKRKASLAVNRARGFGLVEEGFEPQVSVNEAAIAEQIAATFSGMVLSKTNSRNVENQLAQGIESGSTIFLEDTEYFEQQSLAPSNPNAFDSIYNTWETNYQKISNTYEAATGEEGKVTPYRSLALKAKQTASTYDYRGESFNYLVKEIIKDWVLPFLVKKIKKEHILELKFNGYKGQILKDAIAKENVYQRYKKDLLSGKAWMSGQYDMEIETEKVKQMATPDSKLTIPDSYFKDFLNDIVVVIGDDLMDIKGRMNALYEIWQSKDPADPTRKRVYEQMVELSNAISPLEIESPTPETGKRGEQAQPSIEREMDSLVTKAQK